MKTDVEIKQGIMRRVWALYLWNQVSSPALRLGLLGGALVVLSQIISVKDVFSNALSTSGVAGFVRLAYSAVSTTESSVLFFTTLASTLVLWFIAEQVHLDRLWTAESIV